MWGWVGVEGHQSVIAKSSHFTQNMKTVVQSCNSKFEETGGVENTFFCCLFCFFPSGFVTFFHSVWEETQQKASSQTFMQTKNKSFDCSRN